MSMKREELFKLIVGSMAIKIEYSPFKMVVFTTGAAQPKGRVAVQPSPITKETIMQLESTFKVDPRKLILGVPPAGA